MLCLILRALIAGLSDALFAVFDGFHGAAADTCHAMGAVFTPLGDAVYQLNIVQNTGFYAFSAGNAAVFRAKSLCLDEFFIENIVNFAAFRFILQPYGHFREVLAHANTVDRLLQDRSGLQNDLRAFLLIRQEI